MLFADDNNGDSRLAGGGWEVMQFVITTEL
jgi:hypothetical protein